MSSCSIKKIKAKNFAKSLFLHSFPFQNSLCSMLKNANRCLLLFSNSFPPLLHRIFYISLHWPFPSFSPTMISVIIIITSMDPEWFHFCNKHYHQGLTCSSANSHFLSLLSETYNACACILRFLPLQRTLTEDKKEGILCKNTRSCAFHIWLPTLCGLKGFVSEENCTWCPVVAHKFHLAETAGLVAKNLRGFWFSNFWVGLLNEAARISSSHPPFSLVALLPPLLSIYQSFLQVIWKSVQCHQTG